MVLRVSRSRPEPGACDEDRGAAPPVAGVRGRRPDRTSTRVEWDAVPNANVPAPAELETRLRVQGGRWELSPAGERRLRLYRLRPRGELPRPRLQRDGAAADL